MCSARALAAHAERRLQVFHTALAVRHSAGAVELRNALAARFAVELPATVTFDYPNPAALAAFVHSQLPQPVAGSAATEVSMATGWGATPAQGGSRRHRPAGAAGRVVKATVSSQRQQAAAILEQLSDVVTGVLGAAVPPNQPLMEVGVWAGCGWRAPGCCALLACCASTASRTTAQC